MRHEHTLAELRAVFDYDKETGEIRWKIYTNGRRGLISPGDIAGTFVNHPDSGYRQIKYQGILYKEHRLAWLLVTGELPPKGYEIDHKNRIRHDNRWSNLRIVTRGQNNVNSIRLGKEARGVYKAGRKKDKWFARITVNGEIIHLGVFINFEDAVAARKAAEVRYYPMSGVTN